MLESMFKPGATKPATKNHVPGIHSAIGFQTNKQPTIMGCIQENVDVTAQKYLRMAMRQVMECPKPAWFTTDSMTKV
jgi:hypothetical protein